jgi:hypothetical protein
MVVGHYHMLAFAPGSSLAANRGDQDVRRALHPAEVGMDRGRQVARHQRLNPAH